MKNTFHNFPEEGPGTREYAKRIFRRFWPKFLLIIVLIGSVTYFGTRMLISQINSVDSSLIQAVGFYVYLIPTVGIVSIGILITLHFMGHYEA